MPRCSDRELVPRNGFILISGIGARISGCVSQKEESLVDQIDHGKEVVAEYWSGPAEFRIIATKGKGEALDRPELAEIEAAYRSKELDLYIFEDLGRLVRGAEAVRLLGIGVDNGGPGRPPRGAFGGDLRQPHAAVDARERRPRRIRRCQAEKRLESAHGRGHAGIPAVAARDGGQ